MTEAEVETILKDHEDRLDALEEVTGLRGQPETNAREAAHQALVARIHGEGTTS